MAANPALLKKQDPIRLLGSHILYRCDLRQAPSVTIHLGVLAELVTEKWHLLGLAARVSLDKSEVEVLASTWRERLARPFDYFFPAVERAWNTAKAGECIDLLVAEFGGSLFVQPPSILELPVLPQQTSEAAGTGKEELRGEVFRSIDKEANIFLSPQHQPAVTLRGPAPIHGHSGRRSSARSSAALPA